MSVLWSSNSDPNALLRLMDEPSLAKVLALLVAAYRLMQASPYSHDMVRHEDVNYLLEIIRLNRWGSFTRYPGRKRNVSRILDSLRANTPATNSILAIYDLACPDRYGARKQPTVPRICFWLKSLHDDALRRRPIMPPDPFFHFVPDVCGLIREIWGMPWSLEVRQRLTTLCQQNFHVGVARELVCECIETQDFSTLPILADMLEETAETMDAPVPFCFTFMLEHLRGPNDHVEGCWVLDLMLGIL